MDNISDLKISEVMTRNVVVAAPNNTVSQVMRFFAEKMVNHIPVVDNGKLVGIISVKDVVRDLYKNIYVDAVNNISELDDRIKVSTIMTKDPITATADTTIVAVKELFGKVNFNSLPILENDKLVGIVTPKDLMKMRIIKVDGSDYGGY